jgi:hypothetical protein
MGREEKLCAQEPIREISWSSLPRSRPALTLMQTPHVGGAMVLVSHLYRGVDLITLLGSNLRPSQAREVSTYRMFRAFIPNQQAAEFYGAEWRRMPQNWARSPCGDVLSGDVNSAHPPMR